MKKNGPLETSGDHEAQIWKSLVPCSYGPQMAAPGPQIKLFRKCFDFFSFVKWGPSQKMVAQIRRVFGLEFLGRVFGMLLY